MPDWAAPQGPERSMPGGSSGANLFPADSKLSCHYATLDLPETASKDEIRRRYRQLALQYHPDKYSGDPEVAKRLFQGVRAAYEALQGALGL
mmetsp:Transcript_59908/g.185936  ORF Transcript_59908/g.185936 Transcript_59908/m.185936 type:complete len:92 (+) Transcript_59908:515-790(+)